MACHINYRTHDQPPQMNPVSKSLGVMVSTCTRRDVDPARMEIHKRATFELMEGGFYLVQRADLNHQSED
jgi:hypothetical protein